MRRLLLALALCLQLVPALAVQPDEMLSDPALEARARTLSAELRCMVCQNESIDDSDAPLAKDLRLLVREHITRGESDAAIKQFLVARYGDFILLKPPFEWRTVILWLAPFALLALGGAALAISARRRRNPAPADLSAAEKTAVEEILARRQ